MITVATGREVVLRGVGSGWYSRRSAGWHCKTLQMASRVLKRMALARPDLSTDRFCVIQKPTSRADDPAHAGLPERPRSPFYAQFLKTMTNLVGNCLLLIRVLIRVLERSRDATQSRSLSGHRG